uniref:Uncharacterized protein n=1 Tax=Setaria viridis TaxID=4556 RepID=A0A4U6V1H9_SETVI|nr:hypothetical protein SEVIR_4G252701v2 [Setaria viridis]
MGLPVPPAAPSLPQRLHARRPLPLIKKYTLPARSRGRRPTAPAQRHRGLGVLAVHRASVALGAHLSSVAHFFPTARSATGGSSQVAKIQMD